MVTRRRFVLALGTISLLARVASVAQSDVRQRRVGVVFNGSPHSDQAFREAFSQGLRQRDLQEPRDFRIDAVYAEGKSDRFSELIQELIARRPDVIVVGGSAASRAAKQATSTVPIVIWAVGDPVALGLVESFARPGGNVTGNAMMADAFVPKALEILHETVPAVRTVGVLVDTNMPMAPLILAPLEDTAKRLGVVLERYDARSPEELDRVLGTFPAKHPPALMVLPFPLFGSYPQKIVDSLARNRIPAILMIERGANLGGLMGYGVDRVELWRNAAKYVHRILQGAKPADLPVEQPTKFELVVNVKTANAMAVKVPQSILLRADRVIQ